MTIQTFITKYQQFKVLHKNKINTEISTTNILLCKSFIFEENLHIHGYLIYWL